MRWNTLSRVVQSETPTLTLAKRKGNKWTPSLLGDGYQQWHTKISVAQTPRKHLDEVLCWGLKFMASRQFSLFCCCSVKQVKTQWNLMTWKQRSTGRLQFTGVLFRGPCHERLEAAQGPHVAKQPQLPGWGSPDKPLAGPPESQSTLDLVVLAAEQTSSSGCQPVAVWRPRIPSNSRLSRKRKK